MCRLARQVAVLFPGLVSLLLAASTGCAEQPAQYKPFQVSYKSVAALPAEISGNLVRYGKLEQQFMLHWTAEPKLKSDPRGSLIFIHGGCWSNEYDLNHANAFASQLASRGYDVWSVEYRRVGDPGGGWPGSNQDISAAIDQIIAQKTAQRANEPLILAGHSAGGHLALLAASAKPKKISAVVGLAAIARLQLYSEGNSGCQRMAKKFVETPETEQPPPMSAADPALQPQHPATWLLHGTADQIVGVDQTLLEAAEVRLVENAGHFDWLHPKTEAFAVFTQLLMELTDGR